jgi:hypothetical protein
MYSLHQAQGDRSDEDLRQVHFCFDALDRQLQDQPDLPSLPQSVLRQKGGSIF